MKKERKKKKGGGSSNDDEACKNDIQGTTSNGNTNSLLDIIDKKVLSMNCLTFFMSKSPLPFLAHADFP
jgi:transposase